MKNIKNYLLTCLTLIAVLTACNKREQVGETICPENFSFTSQLEVSDAMVNLALDSQIITAGFSEDVNWTLKITGKTSGAIKTYEGRSDSISIKWFGNSESDILFQAEPCSAELSVACVEITSNKDFTIGVKPTFTKIDFGTLLTDFDGNGSYNVTGIWGNGGTKVVYLIDSLGGSPQGGNCKVFHGHVTNNVPVWYYGGFGPSIAALADQLVAKHNVGLDDIYINMYIRGFKDYPNTQVAMTCSAPDAKNYVLNIDWDGWKWVSVKASEFKSLNQFTSFTEVNEFGLGLGAGPLQNTSAQFAVDFMILTVNAPYKEIQKRNY